MKRAAALEHKLPYRVNFLVWLALPMAAPNTHCNDPSRTTCHVNAFLSCLIELINGNIHLDTIHGSILGGIPVDTFAV
jgi:hypothetical protein